MHLSKNKLAVFFPGIGYHCDKPLLYYSRKLVAEAGYETALTLDYSLAGSDITGNIRGNREKMQQAFSYLYEQAVKQLSSVNWQDYDEIIFISKSIGTVIASAYAFPAARFSIPLYGKPMISTRRMPLLFSALPIPGAILKK